MKFSVSEIQQYQRCRRAWNYQSPNRRSLVRIGSPALALQVGSAFHSALAASANGKNPMEAVDEYIVEQKQKTVVAYREQIGTEPSDFEMETFDVAAVQARGLVDRYFRKYGTDSPLGEDYEYVIKEQTFSVGIPGTRNTLIGTFDGIALHKPSGTYWLVEHKTYKVAPTEDKLSTDWQICCYMWAAERLFGLPLAGALYDGIRKKEPTVPELLQSGKMSKKWIVTTGDTYRMALDSAGLDHADYLEILERLDAQDSLPVNEFFTRYKVRIPKAALEQTENTLRSITREMASKTTPIIPNFTWLGCFDCFVRDLCVSETNGEDTEWLIQNTFVKSKGYATFEKVAESEAPTQPANIKA